MKWGVLQDIIALDWYDETENFEMTSYTNNQLALNNDEAKFFKIQLTVNWTNLDISLLYNCSIKNMTH